MRNLRQIISLSGPPSQCCWVVWTPISNTSFDYSWKIKVCKTGTNLFSWDDVLVSQHTKKRVWAENNIEWRFIFKTQFSMYCCLSVIQEKWSGNGNHATWPHVPPASLHTAHLMRLFLWECCPLPPPHTPATGTSTPENLHTCRAPCIPPLSLPTHHIVLTHPGDRDEFFSSVQS